MALKALKKIQGKRNRFSKALLKPLLNGLRVGAFGSY